LKAALLRADRWLWKMDIAMMSVAAVMVLAMMFITALDVVARYAFHSPLRWAFDLVTQYLLIGSFFFAFSYTLRTNENVAVDYFARHLATPKYHAIMGAGFAVATVIFLAVAWLTACDTYEAWVNDEAMMGALVWPTWSAKIIVPLGAFALALRLAHRCLAHWASMRDESFREAIGLEDSQAILVKE